MFKKPVRPGWLIFFLICCVKVLAQQYPIQFTTQLVPPFTGYLEDYSDDALQKLRLLVLQTDLAEPSYDIKLKIKIEGQGIKIQSKNYYYAGPFNLQPGIPTMLSGSDLAGLLNINNLDFAGISKSDYQKKKVLPEGFYEVCITAYDYNNPTQIQVSANACAQAWMVHSDPPYLNFPQCNSKLKTQNPQNVLFQWTAMNLSSPNSAALTDYVFSLHEIRPSGQNPNNIVQTVPPIYQTTVTVPFVNYGITEPALVKGMQYAWRVRAIDQSGRDYFKNNGYSTVCTFTYGSIYDDLTPLELHAQSLSYRSAKFFWDKIDNYNSYTVEYRKTGSEDYHWFALSTIDNSVNAYDLEEKTEYEARLRGIMPDGYQSEWSSTVIFTTPEKKAVACGDMPQGSPLPGVPLQTAAENMIWQVGQFDMIVTKLDNNASLIGRYSGEGKIMIGFLGITLGVTYENIIVNDARVVVMGEVRAMSKGIENWETDLKIKEAEENAIYIDETLDSVYYNNGQVCYTTLQNKNPRCESVDSSGFPLVIRDGEGNEFIVGEDGKITPKNFLRYSTDTLATTSKNKIVFTANPKQQYGFDAKTYAAFTEQYEVIKLKDTTNYFVSYKAVADGKSDFITAHISSPGFDNSLLSFVIQGGTKLTHSIIGAQDVEMEVPSNAETVYAFYNGRRAGKLNVISLKALSKKVVIVPVNQSTQYSAQQIGVGLNVIYSQANVTWDVSIASTFNNTSWDINHDGKLEGADATLFNKYSEEMRLLKNTYQQYDSTYDKKAYYIFAVNQFSNPDQKGYMVRGKAVGFVNSTALSAPNSARLLAHELAHGAFGLEHTFPKAAQGSTDNLLDYVSQTHLINSQWKQMHSALPSFSWLDDEEDGLYIFTNCTPKEAQAKYNKLLQYIKWFKMVCNPYYSACGYDRMISECVFAMCSEAILKLTLADRIDIINTMQTSVILGRYEDRDEKNILRLIRTLPASVVEAFFNKISSDPVLLKRLIDGMDGDDYDNLVFELAKIAVAVKPFDNSWDKLLDDDKVFKWAGNHGDIKYALNFNSKNELIAVIHTDFGFGYKEVKLDPFGYVGIISNEPLPYVSGTKSGSYYVAAMPSIYLYWLYDKRDTEGKKNLAIGAVSTLAFAGGTSTAINATSTLIRVLGVLEASSGAIDMALTLTPVKGAIINKYGVSGQTFVDNVQFCLTIYNLASAGVTLIKASKKFIEASQFWKANGQQIKNESILSKADCEKLDEFLGGEKIVLGVEKIFKNISFNDFANTVAEFKNGANKELAEKAYQLWGENKWEELEQLFKQNNLNKGWPPFNGFKSIAKTESGSELAGKVFDRFQGKGDISGSFASPVYGNEGIDDLYFTYDSRALKYNIVEGTQYIKFKFKSNAPSNIMMEYGDIVPWFGKSGLGDQVRSSRSFTELWNRGDGVIEIIEQLEYRNGKWIKL